MTTEITAGQIFDAGHRAPRGIYECLRTGVLHSLSRTTALPEGGPFRLVASTDALAVEQSQPMFRWPEEDVRPTPPAPSRWAHMVLLYNVARGGRW